MTYRIGFASIDGIDLDQHFGSARYWQIYDLDDKAQFIETRKTVAKCQGHCEGGFDHLVEALKDCHAIFVLKIGEPAAAVMIANGIRVYEAAGRVEDILTYLLNNQLLEKTG